MLNQPVGECTEKMNLEYGILVCNAKNRRPVENGFIPMN